MRQNFVSKNVVVVRKTVILNKNRMYEYSLDRKQRSLKESARSEASVAERLQSATAIVKIPIISIIQSHSVQADRHPFHGLLFRTTWVSRHQKG